MKFVKTACKSFDSREKLPIFLFFIKISETRKNNGAIQVIPA
jgi:hypothetical protein